jgi:hypothetical protein
MRSHSHGLVRASALGAALLASVAGAGLVGVADSRATRTSAGGGPARAAATVGVAARAPLARAAHVLSVKDEGHLHSVRESGSDLIEEGAVTGTIPGTVRVNFDIGPTVTASFTIYARGGGSISGHGSGALHSTSVYSTFGGSLTVTRGTGRYAHAHGKGGLYGSINRKTYALTVQTIGTLYY